MTEGGIFLTHGQGGIFLMACLSTMDAASLVVFHGSRGEAWATQLLSHKSALGCSSVYETQQTELPM